MLWPNARSTLHLCTELQWGNDMGSLRELTSESTNVHLLVTSFNLAEIYVYDTLKEKCNATLESVSEIQSKSEFEEMLDLVNIQPYLASKWLFVITYKKVKSLLKKYPSVFQSDVAEFLVKVENYREFLEFKALKIPCNELYLSVIRRSDIISLLSGYSLSSKVIDFIAANYSRDVDKVFEIRQYLMSGEKIETTKDVIKLCGESSTSTARFALLLLKEMPKSEKGLKMVYAKRVRMLNTLLLTYGYSKAYNFLVSTVSDIFDLKVLYMNGRVYDTISELPEPYDEKRLSRYSRYLKLIEKDIPYERILRLLLELKENGRWRSDDTAIQFLYSYYLKSISMEAA